MALASQADVESALGRFLTEDEDVTTLLEEASDLVIGYIGREPDPVPPAVARAVASMVVAVLNKPAPIASDYQAGGYYQQREATILTINPDASVTTSGPWLFPSVRQRLDPYRVMKPGFQLGSERA